MEKKESISDLQYIKGIGPVRAKALSNDGINDYFDLLTFFPRAYIDRYAVANIQALRIKLLQEDIFSNPDNNLNINNHNEVTLIVRVVEKRLKTYGKNRQFLELILTDDSGFVSILFWNMAEHFEKAYEIGDNLVVSGLAEMDTKYKKISFTHPEIEKFDKDDEKIYREGGIIPIYKMTQSMRNAKFSQRIIRNAINSLIDKVLYKIKDNLPDEILQKYSYPQKKEAVRNLHFPSSKDLIQKSQNRMKFEEIFFFELFLIMRQAGIKIRDKAIAFNPKSILARKLYDSLPFFLTNDQKKVIIEITNDLKSGNPMNRLLQGDVGSGKTIVALLSIMIAIDNDCQTVFLAPTEILAEQHYHVIKSYVEVMGIKVVQLLGGQKRKVRNDVLIDIRSGKANIIVGTHALFESEIEYNKLGLVIIDEQHRFGVAQRAKLKNLAKKSFSENDINPHILVMSATPIPRTLSMTVYGDLDVSIIREKPKDRKPIITKIVFESQLDSVYEFIRKEIEKGRQAYIVYPLVEKSEKLELKAATHQFEKISEEIFPQQKCGLLHGQMLWYEKEDIMKGFLNKEYDILVSTTVIEVGIDVSNVTVMLIENADRFGLSQLHQLRGRIGRGTEQSYCFLATKDNYQYALKRYNDKTEDRKAMIIRLKTMEKTDDGFKISEEDLKLRGPGDVLGTRQSGLPDFKFIDLVNDGDLISNARKEAELIISQDPELNNEKNKILRNEFNKLFISGNNYFDIA